MTFSKFNTNVCKLYKDTQILDINRIFKLEISKLMYKINFSSQTIYRPICKKLRYSFLSFTRQRSTRPN